MNNIHYNNFLKISDHSSKYYLEYNHILTNIPNSLSAQNIKLLLNDKKKNS
uniref:Uncharacterized protein n=1 Tax=Bartonella rochalimae ATCC BAA-1498 TaxID=685782 RepID=E6YKR8_9HYPH|nr:hypothetical protein BARRO_30037 [Bartonella rochalimae ATCC BAA-1498]